MSTAIETFNQAIKAFIEKPADIAVQDQLMQSAVVRAGFFLQYALPKTLLGAEDTSIPLNFLEAADKILPQLKEDQARSAVFIELRKGVVDTLGWSDDQIVFLRALEERKKAQEQEEQEQEKQAWEQKKRNWEQEEEHKRKQAREQAPQPKAPLYHSSGHWIQISISKEQFIAAVTVFAAAFLALAITGYVALAFALAVAVIIAAGSVHREFFKSQRVGEYFSSALTPVRNAVMDFVKVLTEILFPSKDFSKQAWKPMSVAGSINADLNPTSRRSLDPVQSPSQWGKSDNCLTMVSSRVEVNNPIANVFEGDDGYYKQNTPPSISAP